MKISIREAIQDGSTTLVVFASPAGEGIGMWRASEPPAQGREYDAEFEIDAPLEELASSTDVGAYAIERVGRRVRLYGTIESVDEDGLVYFRIAPSCLLMIESGGERRIGESLRLDLAAESLEIFVQGG